MSIAATPTFWLDKAQTDQLKALARTGGDGALQLLRAGRSTHAVNVKSPRTWQDTEFDTDLNLWFRMQGMGEEARNRYVTLLIVNLGAEPMLLVEPPSDPWGHIVAAPVVYQALNGSGMSSDAVSQHYSWDPNNEWSNVWIDAAPTDALGAGSSAVGVFQFFTTYETWFGVGGAVKFSSYGGFDHCYVGGEYNVGAKNNSGVISLADCGSAQDFYSKFVDGTERFTATDPAGSGAYCGCSSKNDQFNCVTAIIP